MNDMDHLGTGERSLWCCWLLAAAGVIFFGAVVVWGLERLAALV